MTQDSQQARRILAQLESRFLADDLGARLQPKTHPSQIRVPRGDTTGLPQVEDRWRALNLPQSAQHELLDPYTAERIPLWRHNIENLIGTVKLPVGLAGPLRVNGLAAQGDYLVPLATTEAALVASYSRGATLITLAGGCSAAVLGEAVTRVPGFAFTTLFEAGQFVAWVMANLDAIRAAAEATTRHGRLRDVAVHIEANHVYLAFSFTTGDASGQNMVTIATDAACQHILANAPVQPQYHFLDANMSGDKKASALSFQTLRGRKVTAETRIPAELVRRVLHTEPARMVEFWRMSALGGVMSGTIGVQGHVANGLAALYIATGQDAACVSESAVGVTRLELTAEGDLYAAVTLPNLMIGTVGGGTGLPSQRACLELMGLAGPGKAPALAEVAGGLCLAGELSIIGAFAAGHFRKAHERLARGTGR